MAEIKIQEKKRSNPGMIILIILILLLAVLLVLDATEVIATPNWIDNTGMNDDMITDPDF